LAVPPPAICDGPDALRLSERFSAILFDFDGTLIDSAPEIGAGLNGLLAERGRPPVTDAQIRQFIGDGAARLVERGFAASGDPLPDDALAPAVARYLEIYAAVPADPGCIYPGVLDGLRALAAAGHRLALCTNKPEGISRSLLPALGMDGLFVAVVGGDTLPRRKPHADPLLHALGVMDLPAGRAVMVGDNANDVGAARAAGMPVVAVSYGYPRMAPERLGADALIDRFHDLPGALQSLAARFPIGG
jgi:phosphoglycolate phosphatase